MYWEVAYYYDKPLPFELRSVPFFSISFQRLLSAHGFVHLASISYWCVLVCSVDHAWRRTSASLSYDRLHD